MRLAGASDLFKAIGHPARLRILEMLRGGGLCVCQVTAVLELAASTVSAHLAELKRAGLVVESRDGRWVRCSLSSAPASRPLLERVRALVAGDPRVAADARLLKELRRVPLETLCRVDVSRRVPARTTTRERRP
jgi:DNA-binding transcriptional ArsR family regulator